jgi:ketosteroid isomerase-like protein
MSQENVEIVRRAIEAFNEGGISSEASLGFFHEDAVFEEPPEQPAPRVGRGREAATEMFEQFDAAWEEHRSETEELRALDADRVLMLSIEHFRGRDGIQIDQPSGSIFTFLDGKIVRLQAFWERKSALEAAVSRRR